MAKITLALVLLLSSISIAETHSFTVGDSTINFANDGREFEYFIDTYQGQILFRFYLPGDDISKKGIGTSCECGGELLKTGSCAIRQGEDAPEKNMVFFSPEKLISQYLQRAYAYAGLTVKEPHKYSIEEIKNFLKTAKNWKLTIIY